MTATPTSERPRLPDAKTELSIDGRKVPVSNLNKVLYPKAGFTKGQVIEYYIRVSEVLLPHLRGRPLTMKRYPNGVEKEFFYEKRCPPFRPNWVKTATIWSRHNKANIDYCLMDNLPSLVWAANLADLELHTNLAKGTSIDRPTMIVFDLDPGPPATIIECCRVGLWLRDILEKLNLASFPKTSGSKGLQVYIPLNTPTTYDATKAFANSIALLLEQQHPELVVSRMEKALRAGKIFVDWSQNDQHKTTVCVYSLRAKEKPTVSTPLKWSEVQAGLKNGDPEKLAFQVPDVLKRVKKYGDLFAPVLKLKQKVPAI